MQLAANAEPEHPRQPLRSEPICARGSPSSSHGALLEEAGGRVQAPDRALAQGAERGERASVVHNDPKARGYSSSRASAVQNVRVGGSLDSFHLPEGGKRVAGLGGDVRVAQAVAHHVVGVVVDVLEGEAVDIEDVRAPLVGGVEPGLHLDVIVAGRPDRVYSRRLDQLMSVANFLFEEYRQA